MVNCPTIPNGARTLRKLVSDKNERGDINEFNLSAMRCAMREREDVRNCIAPSEISYL